VAPDGVSKEGIMTFTVSSHEDNGVIILDVAGTFVGTAGATLRGQVDQFLAVGKKKILLNLEAVTNPTDEMIGTLVALCSSAHKAGGGLKLLKPRTEVRDLFTRVRLIGYPRLEACSKSSRMRTRPCSVS
jgi:anti-anti-sigma regulatory factor